MYIRNYKIGNPLIKLRFKIHILKEYPENALCGAKYRVHGGIRTATCKICLSIAIKKAKPTDYMEGVLKHAIRRARKMGVKLDGN